MAVHLTDFIAKKLKQRKQRKKIVDQNAVSPYEQPEEPVQSAQIEPVE